MARTRAEARLLSAILPGETATVARSNGNRKVARRADDSMRAGDPGAGSSGVKRGRASDPDEGHALRGGMKKKAKRGCVICGKGTSSMWRPVGKDRVKCRACYDKAFYEFEQQSHPGLRCSSCGKDTAKRWYGIGTDSVKCLLCYDIARRKAAKQPKPKLVCRFCGKTTASKWYGVAIGCVKCDECFRKFSKAAKEQREKMRTITEEPMSAVHPPSDTENDSSEARPYHEDVQIAMAAADEPRSALAERQPSLRRSAFQAACSRIEKPSCVNHSTERSNKAAGTPNRLGLPCSSCGKDKAKRWVGFKTDSVKCESCYDKARREVVARPRTERSTKYDEAEVTLSDLIASGHLSPGEGALVVDCGRRALKATLTAEGFIIFGDRNFESPSAFSLTAKRTVDPTVNADDGWKSVRYQGQTLEVYKRKLERGKEPDPSEVPSRQRSTKRGTKGGREVRRAAVGATVSKQMAVAVADEKRSTLAEAERLRWEQPSLRFEGILPCPAVPQEARPACDPVDARPAKMGRPRLLSDEQEAAVVQAVSATPMTIGDLLKVVPRVCPGVGLPSINWGKRFIQRHDLRRKWRAEAGSSGQRRARPGSEENNSSGELELEEAAQGDPPPAPSSRPLAMPAPAPPPPLDTDAAVVATRTQGKAEAKSSFSQYFLTDAEIPNDLYLRFAPGKRGLPTLRKPIFKLKRTTVVSKVVSTLFKKLPEGPHRLQGPEDLELLSNSDVLSPSMTMSAFLQGEGGAHEPPRCEWRRGVENGMEVESVIIDVSYRARRAGPRESPIVIDD